MQEYHNKRGESLKAAAIFRECYRGGPELFFKVARCPFKSHARILGFYNRNYSSVDVAFTDWLALWCHSPFRFCSLLSSLLFPLRLFPVRPNLISYACPAMQ